MILTDNQNNQWAGLEIATHWSPNECDQKLNTVD